jgi:5'-nucleotidase
MHILLTNDDGIHAEGLWTMERVLSRQHEVSVVAPDKERSAIAHSIKLVHRFWVNKV